MYTLVCLSGLTACQMSKLHQRLRPLRFTDTERELKGSASVFTRGRVRGGEVVVINVILNKYALGKINIKHTE